MRSFEVILINILCILFSTWPFFFALFNPDYLKKLYYDDFELLYYIPALPVLFSILSVYFAVNVKKQRRKNNLKFWSTDTVIIIILTSIIVLLAISAILLYLLLFLGNLIGSALA